MDPGTHSSHWLEICNPGFNSVPCFVEMKITQENVFVEERDYSSTNRVLLFITLSTMQHDKMEKLSSDKVTAG